MPNVSFPGSPTLESAFRDDGGERSAEHELPYDAASDDFRGTSPTKRPKRSLGLGIPIDATERTPLLSTDTNSRDEGGQSWDSDKTGIAIFWEEMRTLTKYTLPVFGTHLLEYSLQIASVISIGHISTTALAAVTLGSMSASVSGFSIILGFVGALDTVLPSAWTSSTPQLVGLWSQRMAVAMSIILIPIFAIWLNAEPILLRLKQDPEVAHLAATYLKWQSIGLPAYALNAIFRRYLQSQDLFTVPTRIMLFIAPINALLNYLLVWGPPSIRMGFIGAPIATAVSYNVLALSTVVYAFFFIPQTAWYPLTMQMFSRLGMLMQLGWAGVGQVASEWWSWELIALAASFLGPVSLASQSVLLVSASTTYQAPYALAVAVSVRIGNLLGQRNARRAGIAAYTSIVLSLVMSAIASALFLIFRKSWARIFNDDPEVGTLVASIIPLVALFQVFDGVAGVSGGILRARGRQSTGALLNLTAYYVIGIPLGIWLAFGWNLGLHGLWIGLTVSLVYCAAWGVFLYARTDWNKEVKKVQDRLGRDQKHNEPVHEA